jgi:hypothetical protein
VQDFFSGGAHGNAPDDRTSVRNAEFRGSSAAC